MIAATKIMIGFEPGMIEPKITMISVGAHVEALVAGENLDDKNVVPMRA